MNTQIAIIGGSIAGLNAALEAASKGLNVCVFEEHREIGVPEKCDGLVSSKGLSELRLIPPSEIVQNRLTKAVFFSPSGIEIEIDARRQNVVVLDRARFDKYLAEKAARSGARIEIGKRVSKYEQNDQGVTLQTDAGIVRSLYLIDCTGYESYIRNGGKTLQAGQYLVYGKWFQKSCVEVYLDPSTAPGFFYWVIPISKDMAKIGVAGSGINTFDLLDRFARAKGAVPIRKAAAPIACFGTLRSFVDKRIAKAGDCVGQAKPTTGGGIYTCGRGGSLAGKATAEAVDSSSPDKLLEYEITWKREFGDEFKLQLRSRNIFSKMSAEQIDRLFEIVKSSDVPKKISEEGDFDVHSISIAKALGPSKSLTALGIVLSNEIRNFLT